MRPSVRIAVALALAAATVATGACSRATPTTVPAPKREQVSPPPMAAPAPLDALEIALEPVADGFERPLYLTHAGDGSGRLFVVEQSGRVRVVRDGNLETKPFLDVSGRISDGGERGLLGLAFAPDYKTSGAFFVNYTNRDGNTVLERYTADDPASDTPRLSGPVEVLGVAQPYSNHNGGCIVFEPGTERLWVGMGDGGAGGDPETRAQNPKELLGKMLVLDFSASDKPKPKVVQRGVRNPWRFSFDRQSHDLWIGDVGQNAWEEIDFIPLAEAEGVNWGWNLWEGTHPYPDGADPAKKGLRFPITEYGRKKGQSVTGGYVYRGRLYPALTGTYLYADFEAGWIAGLQRTDESGAELAKPRVRTLIEDAGNPSSFGEDEAGELYVCDHGGKVYRVTVVAK